MNVKIKRELLKYPAIFLMSQSLKAEVSRGSGTLAAGNIHKTSCLNKIKRFYLFVKNQPYFAKHLSDRWGGQTALQSHAVTTLLYDSAQIY